MCSHPTAQVLGLACWKRRVNRRYYAVIAEAQKPLPPLTHTRLAPNSQTTGRPSAASCRASLDSSEYEEVEEEVEVAVPPFRPLPAIFVLPNLPMFGFWLFNTGTCPRAS